MHPVLGLIELINDLTVLSPLPSNRIPNFAVALIEEGISTHDVVEGEIHKSLVGIIRAIKTGPLTAPDQGVVGVCVAICKLQRGFIDQRDQLALKNRPLWWFGSIAGSYLRKIGIGSGHRKPFASS